MNRKCNLEKLDHQVFRIEVGGIVTPKAFRKTLVEHDCNINEDADEMLSSPGFLEVYKEAHVVALALVTNKQLGLRTWASAAESNAKAIEWGLEEILNEVGPQFCFQTSLNESQILMGMKPFYISGRTPMVLSVSQFRNAKWLGAMLAGRNTTYPGRTTWAYKIPDYL